MTETRVVKNETMRQDGRSFSQDQIDLIKRTVARDATNDELALFLYQCDRTQLDPFSRQIHFISRWSKKENKKIGTIQVGIDGFRAIADRTGIYAGNDDPIFEYNEESELVKATVTIWKLVNGQRCAFTASARWTEYYPGDEQGFMWKKLPHLMLGKVAEALALRKAFPLNLSGLYIPEEMDQAGTVVEGQATEVKETHWVDDPGKRRAFYAKAGSLGLDETSIKKLAGIEHIHDWQGTAAELLKAIDAKIGEQTK